MIAEKHQLLITKLCAHNHLGCSLSRASDARWSRGRAGGVLPWPEQRPPAWCPGPSNCNLHLQPPPESNQEQRKREGILKTTQTREVSQVYKLCLKNVTKKVFKLATYEGIPFCWTGMKISLHDYTPSCSSSLHQPQLYYQPCPPHPRTLNAWAFMCSASLANFNSHCLFCKLTLGDLKGVTK